MITTLRKSFKSRAYKIILWITFLAVGGVFSVVEIFRTFFFGKSGSSWIMEINSTKILAPEFQRAVIDQEERIRMIRAQYGQYADMYFQMMGMQLNPQSLAVSSLIRKTLLNQVAKKMPLYADLEKAQSQLSNPMFVYQELSDLAPVFTWDQTTGGINPLALHQYLQHIGVTSSEFDDALLQAVAREDIKNLVEHASYTPKFELKEEFIRNSLGHKFSIYTIARQEMLDRVKKEPVSDEALKAYFDLKNSQEKRYYVAEKRSAKIVTFDPAQYGISISDEDAQVYYNNNKAQYVEQPAQVQVRRILLSVADAAHEQEVKQKAESLQESLVKNPEQFAKLAKENSQDTQSASQGGLMPYFAKGKHDQLFEKTAFLLKEDNDISLVIKTKDGYEILQRAGKKTQTFKPFAQVSRDIKDTLRKKQFAQQFSADMRSVLNQPNAQEAFQTFVKEKNGKETVSKDVTNNPSILAKTLFRLKNNETSFYQDPNQGVAVTATEIKESHVPAFSEIKNQVKEDYFADEATQKISALLEQSKNPGSFEAVKGQFKVEKTGWITKDNPKSTSELQQKGIDTGKLFQLENIGALTSYERGGNGYLIRLDEVAPFDEALFEEKSQAQKTELAQQRKSFIMAGFVASLYRNAKINKNESQIRSES